MGLYQELRPTCLAEVVGNEVAVQSIEKMIKKPASQRPHAFLFTGPSGCGKTTLARILAKEFGCKGMGFIELDNATYRGIDGIRELKGQLRMNVIGSPVKVYLLDECHQLTPQAQEALLKMLEDCPPDVYFILCTTDPQKLIKTVKNRTTTYTVTNLPKRQLLVLLKTVKEVKNLKISDELIEAIAECCDGSPRRALVLLEQVMDIDEALAFDFLVKGTDKDSSIFDICNILKQTPIARFNQQKVVFKAFQTLKKEEPERIRRSIVALLQKELYGTDNASARYDLCGLLDIFGRLCYTEADLLVMLGKACYGGLHDEELLERFKSLK